MASASVFVVSAFMSVVLSDLFFQQARTRTLVTSSAEGLQHATVVVLAALVFSVTLAGALGICSFVLSHRICGPLGVIERNLRALASGRFPKRRPLRKKDEFKGLFDALWKAIDHLRIQRQADLDELTEAVNLARSTAAEDEGRKKEALTKLVTRLERMRRRAIDELGEGVEPSWNDSIAEAATTRHKSETLAEIPA